MSTAECWIAGDNMKGIDSFKCVQLKITDKVSKTDCTAQCAHIQYKKKKSCNKTGNCSIRTHMEAK